MPGPRAFVIGMVAVWGATGLIEPYTPNAGQPLNEIGFIQIAVCSILIFCWVKAHARAKNIEPPAGASMFAALVPPLGVPYYAFKGYGMREGIKLVALSLLTYAAMSGVYALGFALSTKLST
jgi:hypothetical protein